MQLQTQQQLLVLALVMFSFIGAIVYNLHSSTTIVWPVYIEQCKSVTLYRCIYTSTSVTYVCPYKCGFIFNACIDVSNICQ